MPLRLGHLDLLSLFNKPLLNLSNGELRDVGQRFDALLRWVQIQRVSFRPVLQVVVALRMFAHGGGSDGRVVHERRIHGGGGRRRRHQEEVLLGITWARELEENMMHYKYVHLRNELS